MRPITLFACSLLSAFAAMGAQAKTCVSLQDVSSGIRLQLEDGQYSDFLVSEDGILKVKDFSSDGRLTRSTEYAQGVLETKFTEYDDAGIKPVYEVNFDYSFSLPKTPRPSSSVRGTRFENVSDGGTFTDRLKMSFSSPKPIYIGGCEYRSLTVTQRFGWPWDSDEDIQVFLYELGLFIDFDISIEINRDILKAASISVLE